MLDPTPDQNEWKFDLFCIAAMVIFLLAIIIFNLK